MITQNVHGKKIRAFSTFFYPVLAGLEISVLEIYSRLTKQGWDIEMHATNNDLVKKNSLPKTETLNGIKIKRFSSSIYCFMPWKMSSSFNSGGIIHFHDFEILPGIWLLSYFSLLKLFQKNKSVVIVSDHGMFSRKINSNSSIKLRIKKIIDHSVGVFLINRSADKVHTVSDWLKTGLIEAGVKSSLIEVIGNGIEDTAFSDIEKEASQEIKKKVLELGSYILQVGRIDRVKNFEVTINALKTNSADIKLAIAGPIHDKNYHEELIKLAELNGVRNRVFFLGPILGADKYYLMRNALVIVHMSISEGFGNVVLEAMSQGSICIVSKGNALEELVTDGISGFCLEYDDVVHLGEKIKYIALSTNNKEILKMKGNNRQMATNKSWNTVAGEIDKFYIRILEQRNSKNER